MKKASENWIRISERDLRAAKIMLREGDPMSFIPNVVKTRELALGGLNGMMIKVLPFIFEENNQFCG